MHAQARRRAGELVAAILAVAVARVPARAVCNAIPAVPSTFRGAIGKADRPFASPADLVTVRDLAASPGAAGVLVTIVFTPPRGERNAVVLTSAADCGAIEGRRPSCVAELGGREPLCIHAPESGLVAGADGVTFRFPDTSPLADGAAAGLVLTGPVTIAVSPAEDALPCALGPSARCTDQTGLLACLDVLFHPDTSAGNLPDETFASFTALPAPNHARRLCSAPAAICDGSPGATLQFTVDAAGNALVPMDWHAILANGESCLDAVPTAARLVRASFTVEPFAGRGGRLVIPSNAFLRSFTPAGGGVAPIFDPQVAPPDPAAPNVTTIFGSADGCRSVLRIARRGRGFHECVDANGTPTGVPCKAPQPCPEEICPHECGAGRCVPSTCGGLHPGTGCSSDAECPGAECGPALFELRDRLAGDDGPVVVGADLAVQQLVPLEGLIDTPDLFAFVVPEALNPGQDLNGDGDEHDEVMMLVDRHSGHLQRTGATKPDCPADGEEGEGCREIGRAVVRVREPPFSYPAVAADGDEVAVFETEPGDGLDANLDLDLGDTVLRVFRLGTGELTQGIALTSVDPAPLVNGRSLAISNGKVFFRDGKERAKSLIASGGIFIPQANGASGGANGGQAISADGEVVAFWSLADNFPGVAAGSDRNALADVFVRLPTSFELVSVTPDGRAGAGRSVTPALSADGRFVAFQSDAGDLVDDDGNQLGDVFVRDRCMVTVAHGPVAVPGCVAATERVSVAADGGDADGASLPFVAISGDGRFVAFASAAENLVPDDGNGSVDVFVRDRCIANGTAVPGCTAETERVSVGASGLEAGGHAGPAPSLSFDGRLVAFTSTADDLVPGDTNAAADVFVRDRLTGVTTRVSVATGGGESRGESAFPALSGDGRYVAFASAADDLVGDDGNGAVDVFVHDRRSATTERASVAADGVEGNGDSASVALSGDGRYLAFVSAASNLVVGDGNGVADVFVRDQATGIVQRASVQGRDADADGANVGPTSISAEGHRVVFASDADNLETGTSFGDQNGLRDVYVRDLTLSEPVLTVVDTESVPAERLRLCRAEQVAVADGTAVFLVPENALPPAMPPGAPRVECPTTKAGLENGDADTDDAVVHAWSKTGRIQNLRCAARAVALSSEWMAALVDEHAEFDRDLNGDGDANDVVVKVRRVRDPAPDSCDRWRNLELEGDAVAVSGAIVAFTSPVAAGHTLRVYDAEAPDAADAPKAAVMDLGPAQEFVLGGSPKAELVAFRDGDDDSLHVYDVAARCDVATGVEVVPCDQVACDPRGPFKVGRDTVTFVTRDADGRLQLATLKARQASQLACPPSAQPPGALRRSRLADEGVERAIIRFGALASGVCTGSGAICANDAACAPGETCFVPPGECIETLDVACLPPPIPSPGPLPDAGGGAGASAVAADAAVCGPEEFCSPRAGDPATGRCARVQQAHAGGPRQCRRDADCAAPARCTPARESVQRLVSPLAGRTAGPHVHIGTGQCEDAFGRIQGACDDDGQCPAGVVCRPALVAATAADSDGDEIPDPFDNCPELANPLQEDEDRNGVGDACQRIVLPCAAVPESDCRRADLGDARLRITDGRRVDRLVARWSVAGATFGDPQHTDDYALCLYDGSPAPQPRLAFAAPAGTRCASGSCWRSAGAGGFTYRAARSIADGIDDIRLRAGKEGTARLAVKAQSPDLAHPGGRPLAATLTLQLVNRRSGVCWEATAPAK